MTRGKSPAWGREQLFCRGRGTDSGRGLGRGRGFLVKIWSPVRLAVVLKFIKIKKKL